MRRTDVLQLLSGRHLAKGKPVLLSTVSGVGSTKPAMIGYFDRKVPAISIITTKSFQVEPNPGNREPIICETSTGNFGNSVGLRNPGLTQALAELRALREEQPMRCLLNVSLSANNIEDFVRLALAFSPVADMMELNFSCPHAAEGYGASIGCDAAIAARYVREIREAIGEDGAPVFVKLTPNVDDIGAVAKAVVDAGADGLVAINTVGPVVHVDPVSQKPILQNDLGQKGGCSGRWIHERAEECIREIRQAIGDAVPLLGMGGVSSGADAFRLVSSGADAIGIGSALGTVNQRQWPAYLDAVAGEANVLLGAIEAWDGAGSDSFVAKDRQMAYARHTVQGINHFGSDTIVLELDGSLPCEAGQFAFLWLPNIGEKPFSVAHDGPLTFVVKKRGPFTEALWNLSVGSELYVRGLYGAPVENERTDKALLIGGGTGVAVLPALAKKLAGQGTEMTILVGTSERATGKALLEDRLSSYGSFTCIADEGKPGRVLDLLADLETESGQACYLVGPEPFMAKAAAMLIQKGVGESSLYLSMERNTLCGIGMCGECACGDRLTCQWGTFMRYDYLKEHAPSLVGL
jgi:dihydroorotate dehydrogenase (NAD+) catalytic subunit